MITNTGKNIIAKFLVGQVPSYASYMAFGCGAKPLASTDTTLHDYSGQGSLEFEAFRAPITSRGYVTDVISGTQVSSVVLTAELPTEQRYGITEVGIYSAEKNPVAIFNDSKLLYNFTNSENWEYHNNLGSASLGDTIYDASKLIPVTASPGLIKQVWPTPYSGTSVDPSSSIYINNPVDTGFSSKAYPFRTVASHAAFVYLPRVARLETCRVLDGITVIPGDMSYLQKVNNVISVKPTDALGYYGSHIHLSGISLDLDRNSPSDEIKLAFSVINKNADTLTTPGLVRILVEFSSDDVISSGNYARFQAETTVTDSNRYQVVTQKLSGLAKTTGFAWSAVNVVKVYVSVLDESTSLPTSKYFVCLDAIRFDNVTSASPVYGLTGYTVIRSNTSTPAVIVKDANTSNSVEFRFGLNING